MSSTYIVSSGTDFRVNHNYKKILKSDCLSTDGVIKQYYLSNWTVRATAHAHLNSFVLLPAENSRNLI